MTLPTPSSADEPNRARWVRLDAESKASCIYWPDKTMVSIKQNVKFNCDYILVLPNLSLSDPGPVKPESGMDTPAPGPHQPASPTHQQVTPPLPKGEEPGSSSHPVCPVQSALEKGQPQAMTANSHMVCRNASIAKVPKITKMAGDYTMLVSIPACTKPCNEHEAHSSPNWPQLASGHAEADQQAHPQTDLGCS